MRKIRVLITGHTYTSTLNRRKLRILAKLPGIELNLLAPREWKSPLFLFRFIKDSDENYKIFNPKVLLGDRKAAFAYFSLFAFLRKIKPDILHIDQEPYSFSFFQIVLAKMLYCPKAKIVGFTWENVLRRYPFPLSFFERFNLSQVDMVIAGTNIGKNILRERGFRKPIKVIPLLGVDTEKFKKTDSRRLREEMDLKGFVVGYIGRFDEIKGLVDLVEAFALLRRKKLQIKLLLIGKGPSEDEIRTKIKKEEIDRDVIIKGPVAQEEVATFINCMDVLVLPSRTVGPAREQFGHILIEAMACGVPTIGSSSGGVPEVIDSAGLIFQERNISDLFDKLKTLITNKTLRKDCIKLGRIRVQRNYSDEVIARKIYTTYKELLKIG